jgi:hypothetical protein
VYSPGAKYFLAHKLKTFITFIKEIGDACI